MGLNFLGSSSTFDPKPSTAPNPDPANWKLIRERETDHFLIVELEYPDCTTFEGRKILVFKNTRKVDLFLQRVVDPHFSASKQKRSPIARFEPTQEGWVYACRFVIMCEALGGNTKYSLDALLV